MRATATFTPPTVADLLLLARELRPDDARELRLSAPGTRPLEALIQSCETSDHLLATKLDGRLIGIAGVSALSLPARTATLWGLATRHIDARPSAILPVSLIGLPLLMDAVPWADTFTNSVWAGNTRAVRWLRWLGATFTSSVYTPSGAEFLTFTLERSAVKCATP